MNSHTVALVRESWKKVEAIAPAAAALFYENLFAADPGLRHLFKNDMRSQGEKLMRMLGLAVSKLDDLPALLPTLEMLAQRHVGYGVQQSHYETVGAAFLKTLEQGLATDFTPRVRQAWTEVYAIVAGVMTAAANTAQRRTS